MVSSGGAALAVPMEMPGFTPILSLCARHSVMKSVNICIPISTRTITRIMNQPRLYQEDPLRFRDGIGHPRPFARLRSRFNAFDGRVVAVDEERLPAFGEGILQLESILVILARENI